MEFEHCSIIFYENNKQQYANTETVDKQTITEHFNEPIHNFDDKSRTVGLNSLKTYDCLVHLEKLSNN